MFADAQGFGYRLLGDTGRSLAASYEVQRGPDEGNPDYPKRRTFLIDPTGKIAKVYDVTDIPTHPDEVLADIRAMS